MIIIALGVGVQSVTLYYMSSTGVIPRADYAIFSDPGSEKRKTYEYLEYLKKWQQENNGIPIIHSLMRSTLKKDLLNGRNTAGNTFASIPAYTKNPDGKTGMLRRQCTSEYKIIVVDKEIRGIYGLAPYKRMPQTDIWMGITFDEISRAKVDTPQKWKRKVFPFLNINGAFFDNPMTRYDCKMWLIENNLPVPPKSACVFCPFQGDAQYAETKKNDPEEWLQVVEVDKGIRDSSKRGVKQPIYLHESCKPIDEVNLNENQGTLFDNECEGMCGV